MSGLVVASDYSIGQQLVKDHDFKHNSKFFQAMFEIGRRHKIMNPEKMRSEYGKLLYILQDSNQPHVQELLEFSLVAPIKCVHHCRHSLVLIVIGPCTRCWRRRRHWTR